jgi:hypothetical protein
VAAFGHLTMDDYLLLVRMYRLRLAHFVEPVRVGPYWSDPLGVPCDEVDPLADAYPPVHCHSPEVVLDSGSPCSRLYAVSAASNSALDVVNCPVAVGVVHLYPIVVVAVAVVVVVVVAVVHGWTSCRPVHLEDLAVPNFVDKAEIASEELHDLVTVDQDHIGRVPMTYYLAVAVDRLDHRIEAADHIDPDIVRAVVSNYLVNTVEIVADRVALIVWVDHFQD